MDKWRSGACCRRRVSGSGREGGKVYVSQDVDRALQGAGQEAQAMKDEYISVEHILLGLLALKELFRTWARACMTFSLSSR